MDMGSTPHLPLSKCFAGLRAPCLNVGTTKPGSELRSQQPCSDSHDHKPGTSPQMTVHEVSCCQKGKRILSRQNYYMAGISSIALSFFTCKIKGLVWKVQFSDGEHSFVWSKTRVAVLDVGFVVSGQFHELRPGVHPQVPEWFSCFCELSVYTSCGETILLIAADNLKQHTSLTHHCFCLWKGSVCYMVKNSLLFTVQWSTWI